MLVLLMSFRQTTEMCLFLSFVFIVLIQENTCKSESSSRDDPKSVDAVFSSSPSHGNDVKFFVNEDNSGHVKGLLQPFDHSGREFQDIKDESGLPPKRVHNLSSTNLEDRSCNPGQTAMFLLHPWKKQTYVGCYTDKRIRDYCPEFNTDGLQENYNAPYERETCTCNTPATTPTTALLEEPNESKRSTYESPTTTPPYPEPAIGTQLAYGVGGFVLGFSCALILQFFKYCKCCKKETKPDWISTNLKAEKGLPPVSE
uniref:Uncharacterized protein LOC111113240 isoform X2 n=1 Tax=Crassostrea virginica TaxID=6565 RepID=A0A8B8BUK5_CRAVI|nr:uncharacterized protein LOC111113240 isoform X2 [Crassostrea virginica]